MNGANRRIGHIEQEDLALFAMQLLPRDQTAEVAAHVEECTDCRQVLGEIQADLALYAHGVDLHSPPALTRERLLKQVSREKKTVSVERPAATSESIAARSGILPIRTEEVSSGERYTGGRGLGSGVHIEEEPKRGVFSKVFPWVGWALAAGLAVVAGDLYHERDAMRQVALEQASRYDHLSADAAAARQVLDALTDQSAMRVNLTTKSQTALLPQGRVTYVADKGTLIFAGANLEPLDQTKTYELWLIPSAEGQNPIPAGTFRPDERGNATVILPPLPKGVEAKAFGVTVEQAGGASAPTLPIILVGE